MGLGSHSQGRRDTPVRPNHQACHDVEVDEDFRSFDQRSPTRSRVSRHTNATRKPPVSGLSTLPIPLAPDTLIALTSPVIAQGTLLPSQDAPLDDHRSPFVQAFGHLTSLFGTSISPIE